MGLLSSVIHRTGVVTRLEAKYADLKQRHRDLKAEAGALKQEVKTLHAQQGCPAAASDHRIGELRTALADLLAQDDMVRAIPGVGDLAPRISFAVAEPDIMLKKSSALHYLRAGLSALDSIQQAAGSAPPRTVLDFGCGYGRVLRVFKAAWPGASLTACDLMPDGLAFCMEHFDVCGFRSKVEPVMPDLAHRFDLIWAGSVVTHLPADKVRGFIRLWRDLLNPGGKMVFTSHGTLVHERLVNGSMSYDLANDSIVAVIRDYEVSGFGYADYPQTTGYGVSLNSESWLRKVADETGGLQFVSFLPHHWDNHQDVWCFERVA